MRNILVVIGSALLASTGGAYAADLQMPMRAAPIVAAPVHSSSWEGGYAGVNLGYGPGTWSPDDVDYSIDFSGWFAGAQAGYNFAITDGLIFGVEGDVEATNESGSHIYTSGGSYTQTDTFKLDWTGALTGHLGLPLGSFMPYILGGVAFAHGSENYLATGDGTVTGSSQGTHVGYTVGVGAAAQLTDNITGFIEARYAHYGAASYNYTSSNDNPSTFNAGLTDTTVRAGFNFHF